jgi:hypothetical protein
MPKNIFGSMTHDQARECIDIEQLMTLAPPQAPSEGAVIVRTAVATAFSQPPSGPVLRTAEHLIPFDLLLPSVAPWH